MRGLIGLPVILATAFLQRGLRSQPRSEARTLQRLFTWRNALLAGGCAFALLALGAVGYLSSRALGVGPAATLIGRGVLAARERVVVADFAAGARDSALAAAVTEAIRTDLAQSPALSILDRSAIADALARMERPATSALTVDVAREIAQRDGIKGVIAGAINRVGPGIRAHRRCVARGNRRVDCRRPRDRCGFQRDHRRHRSPVAKPA